MAVNVSYKNRIGYYTLVQGENKFKVWFCHANALCAEMYFYKDSEGVNRAQFYSFYANIQHVKNCAKSDLIKGLYSKGVTLFAKEMDKDLWEMAKIFAENGVKVTIK